MRVCLFYGHTEQEQNEGRRKEESKKCGARSVPADPSTGRTRRSREDHFGRSVRSQKNSLLPLRDVMHS
jgi:hypothetical protein